MRETELYRIFFKVNHICTCNPLYKEKMVVYFHILAYYYNIVHVNPLF